MLVGFARATATGRACAVRLRADDAGCPGSSLPGDATEGARPVRGIRKRPAPLFVGLAGACAILPGFRGLRPWSGERPDRSAVTGRVLEIPEELSSWLC